MDHEGRISRLRTRMEEEGVDAFLVTNLTNVRYLTGFSGTNGQVFVTHADAVFLSDPRYRARAGALVQAAEVSIYPSELEEGLRPLLEARPSLRVGVEASTMTLEERSRLNDAFPEMDTVPLGGLVEGLRRQKEPAEVALIEQAVSLGERAFSWLLESLAPGQTEKEIALELETRMRRWGADEVSFPPIVGSGELSAHIHHTPTARAFRKGDLVLADFGCRVDGYCSDLTRTVVLGPASSEQTERYDLVLEAQRAGIRATRAGAPGPEVDRAARGIIEAAGLGDRFGHGLGHGVGLDIHEAPRLNRTSDQSLQAGDVVTVEPGLYVDGVGGIRIEDCVLVTEGEPRVLGSAPKDHLISV
jgi:Xaa-Pro aminopeptidase